MSEDDSRYDQARCLHRMAQLWPLLAAEIICLSVCTAMLKGIGLSFLLPAIELA